MTASLQPRVHDGWIRPPGPGAVDADEPRWGHRGGIQIGLSPIPGPRGLIRIFTPYLDQGPDRLLNFLALEPIPQGATERGYSELEPSDLDRQPGKRFWSSTSLADSQPRNPDRPVPGDLRTVDGVERLSLWVHSERFANDARVAVRIEFRSDRPHEFAIETYRLEDSAELSALVVTATMGNFARLRKLQLRDSAVTPSELWPDFDGSHFAEHRRFGVEQLVRTATGGVTVSAEPDETDPAAAEYDDAVNEHWHYVGVPAVQTWEAEDPDPKLVACVNARRVYWASEAPIPGGDAYENVELIEPFRQGRQFIYRVEPLRR